MPAQSPYPFGQQPPQEIPKNLPSGMNPQKKNLLLFIGIFTALTVVTGLLLVIGKEDGSSNAPYTDPQAEEELIDEPATTTTDREAEEPSGLLSLIRRLMTPWGNAGSGTDGGTSSGAKPGTNMFSTGKTNMFSIGKTTMFNVTRSGSRRSTSNTDLYITPPTLEYKSVSEEEEARLYQQQLEALEKNLNTVEREVNELALIARSSPLRGLISISSVRRSSSGRPEEEYITLTAKNTLPKDTLLTGMILRSLSSGQVVTIGEGVKLPITNELPYKEPIYINPGTRVYVITGQSPLGYSFQINKCSGYFTQFQRFVPSIPLSCPRITTEELPERPNQLSDACLDYLPKIGACKIVTNLTYNSQDSSYDCYKFIMDHTGYNNCVKLHRYDSDFYKNEWRVYLTRTKTAWKAKREIIWLEDQQGRFIAYYSY